MNKITLISFPDYYHNQTHKAFLINPTKDEKDSVQSWLMLNDVDMAIFLYENNDQIEWLLNITRMSDTVYINIDNSEDLSYYYTSYLVSQSNVSWYSDKIDYSILNKDRVRNIDEYIQKHWLA